MRFLSRWTALFAVLTAVGAGCSSNGSSGAATGARFDELDPAAASALIAEEKNSPDFVILDVRTPQEFHDERIEGAINVDFRSPSFRQEVEKLDRDKTYLLYCRTGNRSGQSLATFRALGFQDIRHLSRGITAWKSQNKPTVRG
ncbi:MAG: rhodanese-like domain-containing protein [Candidatus Eisenbacteria bacterium]